MKKIYKALKFKYFLLKKSFLQKEKSQKDESYFSANEQKLFDLLNKNEISEEETLSYFEDLSQLILKALRSSGINLSIITEIIAGKITYSRSGFTPDKIQQVLIDNYCKTNGLFQEILFDFLYKDYKKTLIIGNKSSLFGDYTEKTIIEYSSKLKNNGYITLPILIDYTLTEKIVEWSKNLNYNLIDDSFNGISRKGKIDFNSPCYSKAAASESDLLANSDIMNICKDPFILSILQTTLGAELDIWHLSMWWSFAGKPSSEAAQYYHYDLDSLKWLKVFIYLTDVDLKNGPHMSLPETHTPGNKNYKLLKKRYSRIPDDEIKNYQIEKPVEFIGKADTIIIGDTRCWHKGKEVSEGNRLILQPTYSATHFLKRLLNK